MKEFGIVMALALAAAGCATVARPPQQAVSRNLDAPSLSGKVVEVKNVQYYTYVCLEKNGARTWFAVPLTKVAIGQELAVRPGFEMVNFTSRELKRTFDRIFFSEGLAGKGDATTDEAIMRAHGGKSVAELTGEAAGSAASCPNAGTMKAGKTATPKLFTVAGLYQNRETLDGQAVAVRAKVVKVSTGIMGKNWVHLNDGSGDAVRHTNELVATTQDDPAVGDAVTVTGIIHKDKDFGAGYKFALIMEEASVKR